MPPLFVYDVFVEKRNGVMLFSFPLLSFRKKGVMELIEGRVGIYIETTFPRAFRAFIFPDGRIEIFTYNKM
jgi:hypothetical protein